MQKTSYLITGGFGLIGSSLTNVLEGDITILTRSDKQKHRVKKDTVKVLIKSLGQLEAKDLENIDVIYHCASTVDNYNVLTDPYIDVETNINGTIRLLEACKNLTKKPKIIFLSTFFVYGNEHDKTHAPINEESKTEPLAIYPATKLCTESIIKLYFRLYKIPYLICRLTNVYSENEEYTNKKKGALNYLIMQALKGETLFVYNGGDFYRDYIFLDDVISALMFLEQTSSNDLYLIGYGKPILFKEIINYIHDVTGKKSTIKDVEPPRFHSVVGINNFVADTSKITQAGWQPKIDYKEGIQRIVNKYKNLMEK